jgi:iron complex outermembrane receptor protein
VLFVLRFQEFLPCARTALPWPWPWPSLSVRFRIRPDNFRTRPPPANLGVVTITGGQPTSLPTQIPTTMEGITGEQIEQSINATDSEDALKYFPSLLVRKRYIGDYNHAILSSRASGTGNSARSAVYADGILLSNYLGNGIGGLSFPPRWGLVTPEEIERVDVMYGPFSAAYPGNSVGAVVDYVTRMPTQFEAHAKMGYVSQPFELYSTNTTTRSWQASTSVGNKSGDWAWFLNFSHTDSQGQPLTFATRTVASGTPGTAGTPVTGAVPGLNGANAPWWILGTGTAYTTQQDHFKAKLAWDITPTLRAAYTLGVWQNQSQGRPVSYLQDAAGQPVTSGPIHIGGRSYAPLTGSDFALTNESLLHTMHGLSVKSHTQGVFDWEVAASLYDYGKDQKRQNSAANPLLGAASGGPGTLADGNGTGWNNLALKGIWRPDGRQGAHTVDFGFQQDSYQLDYLSSAIPGNWLQDGPGARVSEVGGKTRLQSLYAQDAWSFAPRWKTVLGLRGERWSAYSGSTAIPGAAPAIDTRWAERSETHLSPKAALSWQWLPDTVLKASAGRAVRFPTVSELYGATATANAQYINDPNLRPEKSWTTELTAERDLGNGLLRLTLFTEDTQDALYSQTTWIPSTQRQQRAERGPHPTKGLSWPTRQRRAVRGLELGSSVTWTDSKITKERQVPGQRRQMAAAHPRVARHRWPATAGRQMVTRWARATAGRSSARSTTAT